MTEEIRQTDALTDEENRRLFGWGENIFGIAAHKLSWRPKDLHFLLYSDGSPLSHVGMLKHVVNVEGKLVPVGGLGGVVTVPEAQKKGFARRLMQHAATFLAREWKIDGLLFCLPRMVGYYEALGWEELESDVLIQQPSGTIVSPMEVMVLPLGESWSARRVELQSLPW